MTFDSEEALLLMTASFGRRALVHLAGGYALCGEDTLLLSDGTGLCCCIAATLEEILFSPLASVT